MNFSGDPEANIGAQLCTVRVAKSLWTSKDLYARIVRKSQKETVPRADPVITSIKSTRMWAEIIQPLSKENAQ